MFVMLLSVLVALNLGRPLVPWTIVEVNGEDQTFLTLFEKLQASLGTRPSKNRKGGSDTSAGEEVYTAPGMKAHFRLAFD